MVTSLQKKLIFALVVVLLCLWRTFPTFQWLNLGFEGQEALKKDNPKKHEKLQKSTMMLGLDLQGGMHLVLQVDVQGAVQSQFEQQIAEIKEQFATEGIQADFEAAGPLEMVIKPKDPAQDADRIVQKVNNLLQLLIAEKEGDTVVVRAETKVIDRQVNFITDKALESIRERVDQFGVSEPIVQKQGTNRIIVDLAGIRDRDRAIELIGRTAALEFRLVIMGEALSKTVRSLTDALGPAFFEALVPASDQSSYLLVQEDKVDALKVLLAQDKAKEALRGELDLLWGKKDPKVSGIPLYLVEKRAPLNGMYLMDAFASFGQGQTGQNLVLLRFNRKGAALFEDITGNNVGECLAIVLDKVVQSAPRIQTKIGGGNAQIEGRFTQQEAMDLAIVLQAGALPADVQILESTYVGPSLGEDSVRKGFYSGVSALVVILLFMMAYYRIAGVLATIAIAVNIIIILGVLAGFRATLTLPGIAGLVLTMGMAVDANVLIYERIREELDAGRTLRSAVENGFSRAFLTIFDSNLTTLLTGLILYYFGTGPIKGFALTLNVGLFASVYSACYLCRALFEQAINMKLVKELKMLRLFTKTSIPFMSQRKKAYVFSIVILSIGVIAIAVRGRNNLGVDFTGGNLIHLTFKEPTDTAQVRQALDVVSVANPQIQMVGLKGSNFIIRTSELQQKTTLALEFARPLKRQSVEEALRQAGAGVYEIANWPGEERMSSAQVSINGILPPRFLDDLKGYLSDLDRERCTMTQTGDLLQQLATALPQLDQTASKIETVGATAGRDLKVKAFWALIWSFVAIILYVWLRYELDMAFGGVIALVHDALFTVGLFALMGGEMSLGVVAAVLTIIGFSINDTIVIYDRVRENLRLNKRLAFDELVNLSVNQCLSRTILTTGTALFAVISLVVFGGEVLRDFSLTLLFGMISGVYSTVYVASGLTVDWRARSKRK